MWLLEKTPMAAVHGRATVPEGGNGAAWAGTGRRGGIGAARGFTLVEVMVALVVIGVVVLGARAMLGQLADSADRITAAAAEADRAANAEALLREAVGRLETRPAASAADETRFAGDERGASFRTWCDVPDGWMEPCDASLGFITVDGQPALALSLSTGEMVALRSGFRAGSLAYLRDAGGGGGWVRHWGASITAPLAIGVVIDGDTSIVRIGERG